MSVLNDKAEDLSTALLYFLFLLLVIHGFSGGGWLLCFRSTGQRWWFQALEIPDVSGSTGSSPLLSDGDALTAASALPCVVINDPG